MHVDRRSRLEVRRAKLERQFMAFPRPSLVVVSTLTQDEVVVVEVKCRRVVEQHFADLAVEGVLVDLHLDVELLESLRCRLPEFDETVLAGESIGLQQNLVLAVVNHVGGEVLGVGVLAYVLVHGSQGTPIYPAKPDVPDRAQKPSGAVCQCVESYFADVVVAIRPAEILRASRSELPGQVDADTVEIVRRVMPLESTGPRPAARAVRTGAGIHEFPCDATSEAAVNLILKAGAIAQLSIERQHGSAIAGRDRR